MSGPVCQASVANPVVQGSAGADTLRISKADGADGLAGRYVVELNGQKRLMTKEELERTDFALGAGDDRVHIDANVGHDVTVRVDGGSGTLQSTGGGGRLVDAGDTRRAPRVSNEADCSSPLPTGSATLDGGHLTAHAHGSIPIQREGGVVPGTPLNGPIADSNRRRDVVVDPTISAGNRLVAAATLAVHDSYPSTLTDPTTVDLRLSTRPLGSIEPKVRGDRLELGHVADVQARAFGVATANAEVRLSFDMKRLEAALAPVGLKPGAVKPLAAEVAKLVESRVAELGTQPSPDGVKVGTALAADLTRLVSAHVKPGTSAADVQRAVKGLLDEVAGPGLEVKGMVSVGVPIGYGRFDAPSTRWLRAPFDGSAIGMPFPATLATVGPTLIPAGVLSDTAVPAGGVLLAKDGASYAVSASLAAKPSLEPGSVGVAGAATVRLATRVAGAELTIEGGWRGRAAITGSSGGSAGASVDQGPTMLDAARKEAQRRTDRQAGASEQGRFGPGVTPAEVLPTGRPGSEGFINVTVTKRF